MLRPAGGRAGRSGRQAGGWGGSLRRYPLVNAAASPVEFLSDGRSMFDADKDMRQRGLDMLAVYHSHPTSHAVPSRTDLERHRMEEVMCMIVSLADRPADGARVVADGGGLSRGGVGGDVMARMRCRRMELCPTSSSVMSRCARGSVAWGLVARTASIGE